MSFSLLGSPKPAFFDSSGSPLVSGTLEFRDPTSNDLINSYPTADDSNAQTNPNANPLTLNSRGEPPNGLFGESGQDYKVVLKDSVGATVWTVDDIESPEDYLGLPSADGSVLVSTAAGVRSWGNQKVWEFVSFAGDRTLVLTDAYKMLRAIKTGGSQTVTIPPSTSVAFEVGTQISFLRRGTATLAVAAGTGVTLDSPSNLTVNAQYGTVTIIQDTADNWFIAGNLTP